MSGLARELQRLHSFSVALLTISDKTSLRAMLVEDNDLVRLAGTRVLERLGYHVVALADGLAAVEYLSRDRDFNVIVLDVELPLRHGLTVAGDVRAIWPNAPILFTTGLLLVEDGPAGHEVILHKPFRKRELQEAINRTLAQVAAHPHVNKPAACGKD